MAHGSQAGKAVVPDLSKVNTKAAKLRYYNSNHGIQPLKGEDSFVLAGVSGSIHIWRLVEHVREVTGIESVSVIDYIGRDFITIGRKDYPHYARVFNAALDALVLRQREDPGPPPEPKRKVCRIKGREHFYYMGSSDFIKERRETLDFSTNDMGDVYSPSPVLFKPFGLQLWTRLTTFYEAGQKFSIEQSERNFLKMMEGIARPYAGSWTMLDPRLWKTPEGKVYAQLCRQSNPGMWDEDYERDDYAPGGTMHKLITKDGASQYPGLDFPLV